MQEQDPEQKPEPEPEPEPGPEPHIRSRCRSRGGRGSLSGIPGMGTTLVSRVVGGPEPGGGRQNRCGRGMFRPLRVWPCRVSFASRASGPAPDAAPAPAEYRDGSPQRNQQRKYLNTKFSLTSADRQRITRAASGAARLNRRSRVPFSDDSGDEGDHHEQGIQRVRNGPAAV